ncbi:two-component response regulator ORR21 [Helianthus annuus]|uniref:two-component response regulator ORR21 n=1 Tax=Helianthus annuus TaxID=4232 RepID=UPI001653096E|nr:two-component response regulator ORR21 [Helianthus annuus]
MKPHPLEASFDPHGLNVLLVDNTFTSLFVISRMLEYCDYQVTPCTQPTEALMLLRNGDIKFDMVLTEVHFSQDMSGMKFLEIVQRESDLPVVIVSAEDRIKIMMESVTKGACAYLLKPVRMEVVRFLWQHVVRKKMFGFKQIDNVEEGEPKSSLSVEDKEICASSDGVPVEDEQVKIPGKKHRLVWTDELHQKFVDAVTQLGIQNAVPKKVLELMNVPGLRRGNVASHLQRFNSYHFSGSEIQVKSRKDHNTYPKKFQRAKDCDW